MASVDCVSPPISTLRICSAPPDLGVKSASRMSDRYLRPVSDVTANADVSNRDGSWPVARREKRSVSCSV